MSDSMPPILFPCLHPESCFPATGPVPATKPVPGALALDPGLERRVPAGSWRPGDLPLSPVQARAALADLLAFGERFEHAWEMAWFRVAGLDDHFTGTAMDYRDEILALAGVGMGEASPPGGQDGDGPDAAWQGARQAAQRLLLLAWHLEARALEARKAAQRLEAVQGRLRQALFADEDPDDEGLGDDLPGVDAPELALVAGQTLPAHLDLATEGPDWRRLAEAMLLLLPGDAVLALCDAGVAQALEVPAGEEVALPGWKLAGLDAADPARPWLDRPVRCLGLVAAEGADGEGVGA